MKTICAALLVMGLAGVLAAAEEKEQTITVTVKVPDGAWKLEISEVYVTSNEVIVVSQLSRPEDMMGIQVISEASHSIKVKLPALPVKHYIVGKTWGWKNDEGCEFVKERKEIDAKVKGAKKIEVKTDAKEKPSTKPAAGKAGDAEVIM